MSEYRLSAALSGHEDDVRDVIFPDPTTILSASRDATVRSWKLKSSAPPAYDDTITSHGSAFINAVAFAPPSPDFPDGLIISGGKDTIIEVRQPGRPPDSDPEGLLLGHQGNVCALDVSPDRKRPYIVSGSWDSSARIWSVSKGESTAELEDHQGSVWAVLAYDGERVITGCADQLIRVFTTTGKLIQKIKGSKDVVRALCRLPRRHSSGAEFASAGNDATVRLWTLGGRAVAQLHGHENFIYSLATLPDEHLVSSSEDRTVRIWKDSECIQTITHPAISVWCVAVCSENGDIVSGASDRIVRVFSRSKERQATSEAIKEFEDSVKSSSIPQQSMEDMNKEKLPGPEFLTQKSGTKEGQVQMIHETNGNITAYQWSGAAKQWIQVGTVVDGQGSSGKKREYKGKYFDYVFDVDIKDGAPALKLPFNLSQNPYEVAQKWIADNELPTSYIDQVANFIITNTQGATLGQASASPPGGVAGSDPWGQESRYRPGDISTVPETPADRPKVLPQKEYLTIATANFTLIGKKITELNQHLIIDGCKDISFSPGDLQIFPKLISQLESILSSTSSSSNNPPPTSSPIFDSGVVMTIKVITTWPEKHRIPGLDLLRCLAAVTPTLITQHDLVAVLSNVLPADPTTGNSNMAMLAIRSLANIFVHSEGRNLASRRFEEIHAMVKPYIHSSPAAAVVSRNFHVAVATLYINYAVLFAKPDSREHKAADVSRAGVLVEDLVTLLADAKIVDGETIYRALVGLGTLLGVVLSGGGGGSAKRIEEVVEKLAMGAKEPRIRAVSAEIKGLL